LLKRDFVIHNNYIKHKIHACVSDMVIAVSMLQDQQPEIRPSSEGEELFNLQPSRPSVEPGTLVSFGEDEIEKSHQ